mmetsp:Transcript_36108/g.107951  ORF Transcript_36108/g.107951 Transcript_36108/m.107951 type:complete len:221 (+) Transcript_36108:154-816(+)
MQLRLLHLCLVRLRPQICQLRSELRADACNPLPSPSSPRVLRNRLPALPELRPEPAGAVRGAAEAALAFVPCLQAVGIFLPVGVLVLNLDLDAGSREALLRGGYKGGGDALALPIHIDDEKAPVATTLLGPRHAEGRAHAAHGSAVAEGDVQHAVGTAAARIPHGQALANVMPVHARVAVGAVDHGDQVLHEPRIFGRHGRIAHDHAHVRSWSLALCRLC